MKNEFSEHSPEKRLKPRLQMLHHLSLHLLENLQHLAAQSFAELSGQSPINWAKISPRSAAETFSNLRSQNALQLPPIQGVLSSMQGDKIQGLNPDQDYLFPEFHFVLLNPLGQVFAEKTIAVDPFHTYFSAHPEKQVLEYLATIFDVELSEWHFACLRTSSRLKFSAQSERAGWNLRLQSLKVPESPTHPVCLGGLSAGLCTLDEGQRNGQLAFLFWGPYLINGQRCEICLPASPDSEAFARDFLNELQQQLAPTGIRAAWDRHLYLVLQNTRPGEEIQICAESAPPLIAPHQKLDLPLPEGLFPSPAFKLEALGTLRLNQVEIPIFPAPNSETDPEPGQHLLNQLNEHTPTSGILASLNPQGTLTLHTTHPHKKLQLQSSSQSLSAALGLPHEIEIDPSPPKFTNDLNQWEQLLQRILSTLPAECSPAARAFEQELSSLPAFLGSTTPKFQLYQAGWRQQPLQAQEWLQRLSQKLQDWLQALAPESSDSQRPTALDLRLSSQISPGKFQTDSLNSIQPEEEVPSSTFDHKI